MQPKFPLDYVELEIGKPNQIRDLVVNSAGSAAERADTGAGEWTEDRAKFGRDADLLIAECYSYAKPITWHLNYPALVTHRQDRGARRTILTHMSQEMLAHAAEIPEECAHDGLVVDI
jgi:ribonuclease BN (tRNA processing enzyme)